MSGKDTFIPACRETVMICALPRSGSNLLCESLESTGRIGHPDEWLNQDRHHWNCGRFGLSPDCSMEEMIRVLQSGTSSMNGVFSHKILRYSFGYLMDSLRVHSQNKFLSEKELLLKYFPNLKLLYIRRGDTLAQAISLLKATQSAIWHNNTRTPDRADPVHFSWTEINVLVRDLKEQEQEWEALFSRTGLPFMPVLYEDLVSDQAEVVRQVSEFLGIEYESGQIVAKRVRHKRTADQTNKKWRRRYEELLEKVEKLPRQARFPAKARKAAIEVDEDVVDVEAGELFDLKVRIQNLSKLDWREYGRADGVSWIKCAAQVVDKEGTALSGSDSWRDLPSAIKSGEHLEMTLTEKAPARPGHYSIWVDLLETPHRWFHKSCRCGVKIRLNVGKNAKLRFLENYFGDYEEVVSGAIYRVDWLGQIHLNQFPDIYHFGLGNLVPGGAGIEEDDFRFKSPHHGVLRTSSKTFPEMWSEKHEARLKWEVGSHAPPRLSIWKENGWVPLNYSAPGKAIADAIQYFGMKPDADGLLTHPWLGKLDITGYPKVKHEKLGFVWCSGPGSEKDSFFFNKPKVGWFWTNSTSYPTILDVKAKEWIDVRDLAVSIF